MGSKHSIDSNSSITWTQAYIKQAEEKFDVVLQEIYENDFIDSIYDVEFFYVFPEV